MGKKRTNEKLFPGSKALVSEGLRPRDREGKKEAVGSWVDGHQGWVRSTLCICTDSPFFHTSGSSRHRRLSLLSPMALMPTGV